VADRAARARFVAAWEGGHAIARPAADRAVLELGADRWPFPIPLVQRGGAWRFDARLGEQALIERRIGRNELDTIATLRALVDAQRDYAATAGRQGALRAYARRFFSTPGARDGLYWATAPDEPDSPLGPLVAAASAGGYARGDGPQPYQGYLFRLLEAQGPHAPGGAIDFLVGDRLLGGFGILAWPARYGDSGVMSFLVSHHGTVFERDLGPETAAAAQRITRFDPEPGWVPVPE
jgi:hypothetical protein